MTIRTTKEHPFYVSGKGWIPSEDLQSGDLCRSSANGTLAFVSKILDPTPVAVFNFEVEGTHTYFVGENAENSVLVHNCERQFKSAARGRVTSAV